MPTIAQDGAFTFIIHTRELPFEPPHVHVRFGGDEVRIELGSGAFMEEPPGGKLRAILAAFRRHVEVIRETWDLVHGSGSEDEE